MRLCGARVAISPEVAAPAGVEIRAGRIASFRAQRCAVQLDLEGLLILPGLINAHDHLEFSLFPRLGTGPYPNASAWAAAIYRPDESPVREQLRVPKSTRLFWGGLKNLLSGVTTVCHHNPYEPLFDYGFPVRVVKRFGWAHSLAFSPDIAARFRKTPRSWPFILHLGEAVDKEGKREIFQLDEAGALDSRTVLVHAVALNGKGTRLARERGTSLVWCPSSNQFLLGRTLDVKRLRLPVALGTDSALTFDGDLLDELRVARRVSRLPAARLYSMVTDQAALVLRLGAGEGTLRTGGVADLIAIRDKGRCPADSLFRVQIELVMVGGKVKLVSPSLAERLPAPARRGLQPIELEDRGRFLVAADVATHHRRAARILGDGFRLAGKRVRL